MSAKSVRLAWLSCVESVIIMTTINPIQPKTNNARLMLTTTAGAALGAAARYVVPTKAEWSSIKTSADTFFSSASTMARKTNRSILKYAGIGAVVAAGISMMAKLFDKNTNKTAYTDNFEYSKYQALINSPEYACEILLYD